MLARLGSPSGVVLGADGLLRKIQRTNQHTIYYLIGEMSSSELNPSSFPIIFLKFRVNSFR